jgi:hypothetical protein
MSDIVEKMKPGSGFPAGGFDHLLPLPDLEKKESSELARYRVDKKEEREIKKATIQFNMKIYSQYKILGELQNTDTYLLIAEALDIYLPELLQNGTKNSRLKSIDPYFKKIGQYFYLDSYQIYLKTSQEALEEAKKAKKKSRAFTYILINVAMEKYLPILRRKYKARENKNTGQEELDI